MIAKGLLQRERSTTDARANTVRLSDSGRAALSEGGRPAARSDAKLLALLPSKKRDSFLKTLATLAAAADAAGAPAKASKPAKKSAKGSKPKSKAKAAAAKKKAKKAGKRAKAA